MSEKRDINEEFEKVSNDLDKELSKFEKVGDIFNDSLDRMAGSVSDQEVDKLLEQMQSEVNLDKKSAALGKQKDQELADRLKAIRDPRPTEEALKNPAPIPTVKELEDRLKKLKDSTKIVEKQTAEKPQKKIRKLNEKLNEKLKDNEIKQSQSIKPIKKAVNKAATSSKDNKLQTNAPAALPEPVIREPSESDKRDKDTLPPSMTKPEQTTGWFAKIINAIIEVIVDNIKGLLGKPQIQDTTKQQSQQMPLEKVQADVKKLNEPLVAFKKRQELRTDRLRQSLQKVRQGKTPSSTSKLSTISPTKAPTKPPVIRQKPSNNR